MDPNEEPPPPANPEVESALLADLMANNAACERVADFLAPAHFADDRHGRIYEAIVRLVAAGRQANALTLKAYFEHDSGLAEIGGIAYLAALQANAVLTANPRDYALRIVDLYRRRALIALAHDAAARARTFTLEEDAADLIRSLEGGLFALAEHGATGDEPVSFDRALGHAIDTAQAAFRRGSTVTGVTTGFRLID